MTTCREAQTVGMIVGKDRPRKFKANGQQDARICLEQKFDFKKEFCIPPYKNIEPQSKNSSYVESCSMMKQNFCFYAQLIKQKKLRKNHI